MSNTTNTGDIFAAFIEADKAIKELPAVREELELTKVDLELTKEERASALNKAELLASTIDTLRTELAQKEAELASATFRESQLKFVVDTIRGALPEPVVPAVAEPNQQVTATEPKEDITNVSMDPTLSEPVQTADGTSTTPSDASASTSTEDQRDTDPTPAYTGESTHTAESSSVPADDNLTEVANTAIPTSHPTVSNGPTASFTPVHDGSPVGPDSPTTSQHDTPAHKPYLGWAYWERPDHVTIERFVELGGKVPSWMMPGQGVA